MPELPDLPAATAPLMKGEIAVFGDSVRHPVTHMPIQRGSCALSISEQARGHLRVIAHHHGIDVAMKVKADLEAFEAAGGTVEMPPPIMPLGFERATIKGDRP